MFSTLTATGAAATLDALSAGASDYVTKPANVGSVTESIRSVREQLIPRIHALTRPAGVGPHRVRHPAGPDPRRRPAAPVRRRGAPAAPARPRDRPRCAHPARLRRRGRSRRVQPHPVRTAAPARPARPRRARAAHATAPAAAPAAARSR